jgi:radical SAM family uncharacterized protein
LQNITSENETLFKPLHIDGRIKIALVFPNTYHLGMSNLGYQTLYRLFNSSEDISCERVFLPDHKTLKSQNNKSKILSLETERPLTSFNVIAFSLTFENDYLNILSILKLANIPFLQKERNQSHPLLMAGGITTFLNPEPIADFFDLFFIGEAEENIEPLLEIIRKEHKKRKWGKPDLDKFTKIDNVYIPSGYKVSYKSNGQINNFQAKPGYPDTIKYSAAKNLNLLPSSSAISTPNTEFSNMALLEVSRGCPRHCRFCAAGNVYQPYRLRDKKTIKNEIRELLNNTGKIGLLGSAVSDHPDLIEIIEFISKNNGLVSLSSLRADKICDHTVSLLKKSGHRTFTIAPEAGSQRLRDKIRKDLSLEEILNAARVLSRHKIQNIKLYFLIGLPTEESSDIDAIIDLTKQIKHAYFNEAKNEKGLNQITLSINPFIPKPFTPFQWSSYEEIKILKQKLKKISSSLKKERKIKVNFDLPKWGYIQTLLSRGDRKVSRIILEAFNNNSNWTKALKETDLNPDFYVYRERDYNEILPWEFIMGKEKKEKLWAEYNKAVF